MTELDFEENVHLIYKDELSALEDIKILSQRVSLYLDLNNFEETIKETVFLFATACRLNSTNFEKTGRFFELFYLVSVGKGLDSLVEIQLFFKELLNLETLNLYSYRLETLKEEM